MRLILLGVPGAGKGTQAKIISQKLGIPAISTGDLLRAAVEAETPVGLAVKDLIASGELVSDDIIMDMVRERTGQDDCKNGCIFDGMPRTQAQAEALEAMGLQVDCCLFFDIADEEIIKRLSGRRTCKSCGSTFHLVANPPKREDKCDNCGGELYTRHDDQAETVARRLEVFRAQTAILVDFYKSRGKLKVVPSGGTVEETTRLVLEALGVQ